MPPFVPDLRIREDVGHLARCLAESGSDRETDYAGQLRVIHPKIVVQRDPTVGGLTPPKDAADIGPGVNHVLLRRMKNHASDEPSAVNL